MPRPATPLARARKWPNFVSDFNANMAFLRGNRHMSYFVSNGKDGKVYTMHDPADPFDRKYDNVVIKIWNPEFRYRGQEVDIHQEVLGQGPRLFKVPELHHVDFTHGAFAMEKVPGLTAFKALYKARKRISKDFFDDILRAFQELNEMGVCHNDAHNMNYMLSNIETEVQNGEDVVVDAQIWIIDFGRSLLQDDTIKDIEKLKFDLSSKVVN